MREILFRGKRPHWESWVEGFYIHVPSGRMDKNEHLIQTVKKDGRLDILHEVYPDTVGQFTGLVDKHGKKIFEGDLFRDESEDLTAVVIFKDGCFRLEWHGITGTWTESGFDECGGGYGITECEPVDYWYVHDMEVIGNIHDNPELLEGRL